MAQVIDFDTGIGSSVANRALVHMQVGTFPTGSQADTVPPDTGIFSSPAQRATVFDEFARPVLIGSPTGSQFNTSGGGPS